ncbi:hypothetical protein ACNKHQ_05685 [Shigella flexneri]
MRHSRRATWAWWGTSTVLKDSLTILTPTILAASDELRALPAVSRGDGR